MRRLTRCAAFLLTTALSAAALAQDGPPPPWFESLVKGSGHLVGAAPLGNFEMMAIKGPGAPVGSMLFVGHPTDANQPVVIALRVVAALAVDGRLGRIEGEGTLNGEPARIAIEAEDLAVPDGPRDVFDRLSIKAVSSSAEIVVAGTVRGGDILVVKPPPPPLHEARGNGVIAVSNATVGMLDVRAALRTAPDGKSVIEGVFTFKEHGADRNRPKNVVTSKRLVEMVVEGRKATIRAEVMFNNRPALAELVIEDNRGPGDPDDTPKDSFRLTVRRGNETVYGVGGPLVQGDLFVR
ncbi:MAG: hypothetical protein AMXMBFR61_26010 [Fimbriimonadales bacterium]